MPITNRPWRKPAGARAGDCRQHLTLNELLCMIVVFIALMALTLPPLWLYLERRRASAPRVSACERLKQLGLVLLMYGSDNPRYCSPLTSTDRASWAKYRYIGPGVKDDNAQATVTSLSYYSLGCHPDCNWCNALFIDAAGVGTTCPWHGTGPQPRDADF